MRARKLTAALAAVPVILAGTIGIAYGDEVENSIGAQGRTSITAGGTTTIRYWIAPLDTGGDKQVGCNASDGTPVTVTIDVPANVTADKTSLTFSNCGSASLNYKEVTFSSTTVGDNYFIKVSNATDDGAGKYATNSANWFLSVTAPIVTNTKPSVAVTGVANGAEYVTGEVPAATCDVTDAEQPNVADFPAALSGTLVDGLGTQIATCDWTDAGGLKADTATVTYAIVPPPNTAPTVELTGVEDGRSYEIRQEPSPVCEVTDKEDGNSEMPATITGDLSHGLGTLTASCDYTDEGGLPAVTKSATYTIVDTGKPTITHSLTSKGTENGNGWYNQDVTVTFICEDEGSGIESCLAEGEAGNSKTLAEGEGQSVRGTATDYAGNTESDTASGINIDETDPTVSHLVSSAATKTSSGWYNQAVSVTFTCDDALSGIEKCSTEGETENVKTFGEGAAQSVTTTAFDLAGNTATDTVSDINIDMTAPTNVTFLGGPAEGGKYYPNNLPAEPRCTADDALSGAVCLVTGYTNALGEQTLTATATDNAGNTTVVTRKYTVRKLTLKGFYAPVDMGEVFNTLKAGSTVPLKFEVFDGSTELTDIAKIKGFSTKTISCTSGVSDDAIENLATTGGTSLRYDTTAGQFVQNWKTPTQAGKCLEVRMTTEDDSSLTAWFKLK